MPARIIVIVLAAIFQLVVMPSGSSSNPAERAAEFDLIDMHGQHHRLADYHGRVVLLNFWATWCPECTEELPSLNALHEKYKERGLSVIGVSTDRSRDPVERLVARLHITYPIAFDNTGGTLLRQYRTIGLPFTVIIDRNGFIRERMIGGIDFNSPTFTRKIESLMIQRGK